ncbi:hypothetical protein Acr_17g0011920 [Actinidia rufa]|uniref:Uncharacterized protein n=1 Tax=Actinidia rufa TaxID=165716 RepID=A0A7J0G4A3_9ERIC|nr:hypothetical protein Acr_17g0011920 [Actinidia rufa]
MTTAEAARRNVGPSSARCGLRQAIEVPGDTRRGGAATAGEIQEPEHGSGREPCAAATGGESGEQLKGRGEMNGGMSTESTESLENPLVSLECFIFL